MEPLRADVVVEHTWNLEALYPTVAAWEKDLKDFQRTLKTRFRTAGKPLKSTAHLYTSINGLLDLKFSLEKRVTKLHLYAELFLDQDTNNDVAQQAMQRIQMIWIKFEKKFAWVKPKVLSQPVEDLQCFPRTTYATIIQRYVHLKAHTLSEPEEAIVASAQKIASLPLDTFNAFTSDLKFPEAIDSQGVKYPITLTNLQILLQNTDRILRENVFRTVFGKFLEFENTFTHLLSNQIQYHVFEANARKYSSCLEWALAPNDIDVYVYKNLVAAVRANIAPLHRYMELLSKLLKVDTLHAWDLHVPLAPAFSASYSYEEAVELIVASCKPLGQKYVNTLTAGLLENRWVDRYPNQHKSSAAYAKTCYGSSPYILMNYKGTLSDVFTLAHEAAHGMHYVLANETQPYHYAAPETFVEETVSAVNEDLLTEELLRRADKNPTEKAAILHEKLEQIRGGFFRQTLFAEFELFLHTQVETGKPITPDILKKKYRELNAYYYGKSLTIDDEVTIEWARIPHFYFSPYHVYQYATGMSAAQEVAKKLIEGSQKDRDTYLEMLKSGCKDSPIKLLQTAGVDMNSSSPIKTLIDRFSKILSEFERLSTQLG